MKLKHQACPHGKVKYTTEQRALDVLATIWASMKPGRRLETRAYLCDGGDGCGYWHLTSKPRRDQAAS